MKRATGLVALVLAVSLLGASEVLGGAAGAPAGKTTGPSMIATIVMDLTGNITTAGKGVTSMRIQRSGTSAAALFQSGVVFGPECSSIVGDMAFRFQGKLNGWVPPGPLTSLFGASASKAVITDTDYASCTDVIDGLNGGTRHVLSFTATIQFETP
jgi:hypothetical protein